ncbi:polar amino acid transport system permease protein [Marmoricola sp. URHA0025 HA25]
MNQNYSWDWSVLGAYPELFVRGLEMTLLVSLTALVLGTIMGLVTATMRLYSRLFRPFAYIYVEFFRTTPALAQLVWVFFVLPILFNITLPPFQAGALTLGLNSGAYLSEIFRGALKSIDPGQGEAAKVLGFSSVTAFRFVLLPQAMRRAIPATANVFIGLIKDSSLLMVIGLGELTNNIQTAVGLTFRPLEFYTALAVLYFVIAYPLALGARSLEQRLGTV